MASAASGGIGGQCAVARAAASRVGAQQRGAGGIAHQQPELVVAGHHAPQFLPVDAVLRRDLAAHPLGLRSSSASSRSITRVASARYR